MKLSLSNDAKKLRSKKVVHVVSAQDKQDEVKSLSSDIALELSEAKSEILRLKAELDHQQIKISNNFKIMKEEEVRALKGLFNEEKRNLINKLEREHRQQIIKINIEHEQTVQESILAAINSLNQKPKAQSPHQNKEEWHDPDGGVREIDLQYERDNGGLDPSPYNDENEW